MKPGGDGMARGIAALALVVVVGLAAVVVVPAAGTSKSWYPEQWDERVAPIAAKVAKWRGHAFKHPVAVKFLPEAEFEKEFEIDQDALTEEERVQAAQGEAMFRALGLIGGDVDMLKAIETTQSSSVLAYYDHEREEIVVSGTKLDASLRVTLAHELVHVLQDQYLDLDELGDQAAESETGDEGAYRALVEGDANRIEDKFVDQMPAKEKLEYENQQGKAGAEIDDALEGVPALFPLLFGAPYIFGPTTIQILEKMGGNDAIDRAIQGSTPTSRLFIEPAQLDEPTPPGRPPVPDRAEIIDESPFGPFEAYLTLGMELPPVRALAGADAIDSGRATVYERNGKVCVRTAFSPRGTRSPEVLRGALNEWAAARPDAKVVKQGLGFVACDPGKKAGAPADQRFGDLTTALALRTGFTAELVKDDQELGFARCAARVFTAYPGLVEAAITSVGRDFNAGESQLAREAGRAAGEACRADLNSGLS